MGHKVHDPARVAVCEPVDNLQYGLAVQVQGFGFRVKSLGMRIQSLGLRV